MTASQKTNREKGREGRDLFGRVSIDRIDHATLRANLATNRADLAIDRADQSRSDQIQSVAKRQTVSPLPPLLVVSTSDQIQSVQIASDQIQSLERQTLSPPLPPFLRVAFSERTAVDPSDTDDASASSDQIQSVAKRQTISPLPPLLPVSISDQIQSVQIASEQIQTDQIQSVAKRPKISAPPPPFLRVAFSGSIPARIAAIAVAVALAACGSSSTETPPDPSLLPAPDSIQKTTEVGPVKAVVRVWPAKPSLIDTVYLRLEISAPDGVTIDAPFQEAGDQRLGRFRVVGFSRDTQRPATGGQLHVQTYTLEPPASGRQRIPPLRFEMLDGRATASADAKKKQEILTDEVPLEIAPVPVEQATAQLKDARGELDPDVGKTSWVLVIGLVGGALMVGSGSILLWRGVRSRRRVEQQRSAYEDAVSHLRRLEDKGAPDTDAADSWFVELSAIVRRYLEGRYEIRAPELTTEEFLQVAIARPELTTEHRKLLEAFLERCDRVKFAGYRPDAEESIATLAAARGFVEDTRLREVPA